MLGKVVTEKIIIKYAVICVLYNFWMHFLKLCYRNY